MNKDHLNMEKFDVTPEIYENKLCYNFSPGPCILPNTVLEKAQGGIINYKGSMQSVMELSHRKP